MLSDPQTVTINAVANTLAATLRGVNESAYTKDDGNVKLSIKHSYGARSRRVVRLDFRKIAADPLTAVNKEFSLAAYLVIDTPKVGFTVAEAKQVVDALTVYLAASSGAAVTAVLGGQS
jgi:hypothetical protein